MMHALFRLWNRYHSIANWILARGRLSNVGTVFLLLLSSLVLHFNERFLFDSRISLGSAGACPRGRACCGVGFICREVWLRHLLVTLGPDLVVRRNGHRGFSMLRLWCARWDVHFLNLQARYNRAFKIGRDIGCELGITPILCLRARSHAA